MKHLRCVTVEKASNLTPLADVFYRILNSIDLFFYNLKYSPVGDASFFLFSNPFFWIFPDDAPDGGNGGGGGGGEE